LLPYVAGLGRTPPKGLWIPLSATADRAKSMAAIGVQLVKYIVHLLDGKA